MFFYVSGKFYHSTILFVGKWMAQEFQSSWSSGKRELGGPEIDLTLVQHLFQ